MKYMYGAGVQGIQDFIFATNKLKEIVGASEIVKRIERMFEERTKGLPVKTLRNAGGNVKAVFENEEACRRFVETFPKKVMQSAYGITISQAVVAFDGDDEENASRAVEEKLRAQRNRPAIPLDMGLGIMKLNPATSKPAVEFRTIKKKEVPVDTATRQKLEAYDAFERAHPEVKAYREISDFSNAKNKIAVIHADGNGLGALVPKLGSKLSEFSVALKKATQKAFDDAKKAHGDIRDVILGGDDMVVVCNADVALEFTRDFLRNFEKETKSVEAVRKHAVEGKLTACAGIAYCNEKFPFHYAVALAESLCDAAKKASHRRASCLMFHNIQSSYYGEWESIVAEELTLRNDKETIRCDFGPYYLDEKKGESISSFMNTVEAYRCDGSPISRLRSWIGELDKSSRYAERMLKRINEMAAKNKTWDSCIMNRNLKRFNKALSNDNLIVQKEGVKKTPIYDVLQILSATEARR